jgi:hypothetical protein
MRIMKFEEYTLCGLPKVGLVVLTAVTLSACAATKQFVPLPDQSKTIDDPTKGRIYVMRPTSFGAAIPMTVNDGSAGIGQTGPKGFLCWERSPGDAQIESRSEGLSVAHVKVKAGTAHYIFQHIKMGVLQARSELELVPEDEGKKILMKCKPPITESR